MSSKPFAPKPLQVAAAVIGNALEWYDFIVFGFFTVIIARLFFPSESQYASLLLTTATFGVGFFMKNGIKRSELLVFESCSHAPIYESVSEFNQRTLSFLSRQTG